MGKKVHAVYVKLTPLEKRTWTTEVIKDRQHYPYLLCKLLYALLSHTLKLEFFASDLVKFNKFRQITDVFLIDTDDTRFTQYVNISKNEALVGSLRRAENQRRII